ncbi:MAG: glycosyltransferase family 4 protein [Nostoc sp. EfeVER01]|uniref:glycosyltransferase family 4 protein n=1 Tax=unclassified Nostoc TaxID=2593658 RepID=UPI002AD30138|nr:MULTISPECIES: glycosyltransferase family 1 protein [unclassified Nostoc]MDZ7944256.1 glycosyltransferase family 1 protein [Nostoc sp. EfeVER01]MDZ7994958.1 glycosyltransferase family 1 protein [Nostoc sp. EspVER01]
MLKIVVDATPVDSKPSGVGFYVANLICALDVLQKEENFQLGVVYQPGLKNWLRGDFRFPKSFKHSSQQYLLPLPVRISDLLLALAFKPSLSYFEKYFGSPDILHGTNYSVYPCQNSLKVMNIYDLTFIKYPNYIDSVVKTYTEKVKRCLQWTDLVLTISESSKKDIIEYLKVDPSKVYVTPLASRYYPNYLSEEIAQELEKQANYDFSKPYLLFVSTIEPRKNINTIITAFNFLKEKYKIEHQLILIGKKGWNYEPIFAAIENSPWANQIHHLNYLSNELVALFYSKADVFVYPSHYEGFGLPVLEAMTLGAPVISSNTSSIPEVTGDAAILVDPSNSIQLGEAILKVISNSQLRQELIHQGKARAKLFSWERTAKETLNAYRTII